MSLPVIDENVVFSVLARSRGEHMRAHMDALRERLREKDPAFVALVEGWCSCVPDPDFRQHAVDAGMFAYALLESQAAADALGRELDGKVV